MADDNKKWLVSFDTDKIKDYIFATNSLREIRGASAILLRVEEGRLGDLEISRDDEVYAAGGGGAYRAVDKDEAEDRVQKIERHFRQKTVSGSITAVKVEPITTGDNETKFRRMMTNAARAMQRQKSQKAELANVPVAPYMFPCAACGQLPAEGRLQNDPSGELLCAACSEKRKVGKERRIGYTEKFLEHLKKERQDIYSEWENAKIPEDLTKLADLDGSNYIGFIMMDGNRMGDVLEKIAKPESYQAYSQKLKSTVEQLVYDTLADLYREPIQKMFPFEIVLIGGDDVMIFTTAKMAMDFTVELLRRFEKSSKAIFDKAGLPYKNQNFTMSAGVVFCHGNFPVPVLVEIGESLLKNAKKMASQLEPKYASGTIDFQVVTGSMIDLEIARAAAPYHRPFTCKEMEDLLYYAQNLKIAPTQLQIAYDASVSGTPVNGTMATLRLMGRLRDFSQRNLLKKFFDAFRKDTEIKHRFWPWTRIEVIEVNEKEVEKYKTAFVDLIDLYRFALKEKTSEPKKNQNEN